MSVTPIRPSVEVKSDPVREMMTFLAEQLADFAEYDEPVSVAIVFSGKRRTGASSWSMDADKSILTVCAEASAVLMNRAMQEGLSPGD